jgi:plastocyanin
MRYRLKLVRCSLILAALCAAPALAADVAVTQKNQTFSSATLSVHVGDTVRFENADTVTHNITVKGGGDDDDADDLGLQKPGATVSHKFATHGSYRVVCSIHPRMKMTVNVQ